MVQWKLDRDLFLLNEQLLRGLMSNVGRESSVERFESVANAKRPPKSALILVNLLHSLCLIFVLSLAYSTSQDIVVQGIGSAVLILVAASASALIWAKAVRRSQLLDARVPVEKLKGLKIGSELLFSGLWFIPCRTLVVISDALWSSATKKWGPTLKAVVIATADSMHFIVGALLLLGVYMGLTADFGRWVQQIARVVGTSPIGFALIVGSTWASNMYFFNAFLRMFLTASGEELK